MDLYLQVSLDASKRLTQAYSTSFSSGIRTLDKSYHEAIYAVYGFVRLADEIVDTFYEQDQADLLTRFRQDTYRAIEEKISLNPILHSFQWAVNKFHMERDLIDAFLYSMEMDLTDRVYDQATYKQYIYGSAEVVGLMCLRVFCAGDLAEYERLKPDACALGSAFQKINFLRDIKSDFEDRGRVYFPGIDYNNFTESEKKEIEADIQADFDAGLRGIENLPKTARKGVLLAYEYYIRLFEKIKLVPVERLKSERIRVPDWEKLLIYLRV
ncbi:phytoene/squalene synthase family protein [Aquirufa sp. 5-AUSEE-100C1]|jgi:phytoene/squalene synthetase